MLIHVSWSNFGFDFFFHLLWAPHLKQKVRYAATSYAMKAWRWEPNFCVANLYRDPDARRQNPTKRCCQGLKKTHVLWAGYENGVRSNFVLGWHVFGFRNLNWGLNEQMVAVGKHWYPWLVRSPRNCLITFLCLGLLLTFICHSLSVREHTNIYPSSIKRYWIIMQQFLNPKLSG